MVVWRKVLEEPLLKSGCSGTLREVVDVLASNALIAVGTGAKLEDDLSGGPGFYSHAANGALCSSWETAEGSSILG